MIQARASKTRRPLALSIAGFDPSGGAGVLADTRTFLASGCRAAAVITSITFQNSSGVSGAFHQSAKVVRGQLLPLLQDPPVCVKTGMLPTGEVVSEVARFFHESSLPSPVVDPVMISSSGYGLMEESAVEELVAQLLPLARLVTPNIPEAERLAGIEINSEEDMREAALAIRKLGARAVLIKGGHLKRRRQEQFAGAGNQQTGSSEAIDVLDHEGAVTVFRQTRVAQVELHGTGCMLSAVIAAGLGKGMSLEDSVGAAKQFVLEAIRNQAASA